jgi:hypothetical protein
MKLAIAAVFAAALFGASASTRAEIVIRVDKTAQLMTVIRDGDVIDRWPVSTGRSDYATPSGAFKPFRMEADHHSDEWDDAPMPHSIFFTMKGHAIHGTYETKHLGLPVSHGCVRISAAHATELFAMVKADGMSNTKVIVTGGGGQDLVARRASRAPAADDESLPDASPGDAIEPPPNQIFFTPRY